jgi:hypothetical protein
VTGIWRDVIKTYDNTSYIEGVKGLSAKSTYFMLEKTARITYNMHKLIIFTVFFIECLPCIFIWM